jgi:hypothetical protein
MADRVVVWTAVVIGILLLSSSTYQYGFDNGAVSCKPTAPIQLDLKRMTLWKAKGEV